eukprot:6214308-Pleurochrysis_carterae.AAC.4
MATPLPDIPRTRAPPLLTLLTPCPALSSPLALFSYSQLQYEDAYQYQNIMSPLVKLEVRHGQKAPPR